MPEAAAAPGFLVGVRELIRGRIGLLRLLSLAGSRTAAVLIGLMLLSAALPAAIAVTTGVVVGRVVEIEGSDGGVGPVVVPLVVLAVVLVLEHLAQTMLEPIRGWAASRVNGAVRHRVRAAVGGRPGIAHLETQVVREAATLPVDNAYLFNLGAGAEGQLFVMTRFVGALLAAAVVAAASPVAGITVLVAMIWQRALLRRHYAKAVASALTDTVADGRAASYWSDIASRPPAAKEVRVFGLARWVVDRYERHGKVPVQALAQVVMRAMPLHSRILGLNTVGALVSLVLVARAGATGDLEPGQIASALGGIVAVMRILGPMGWEAYSIEAAVPLLDAVNRLEQLREDDGQTTPAGHAPRAPFAEPPLIRFEQVTFRYPGGDRDILRDVDLELRPGESIAVVGANGAGKTTLLKLLAGFYAPDKGRISVNGEDLQRVDLAWWRRHLAVIFQDFSHFELSAFENVTLRDADSGGSLEEARWAATTSGALDVVEALPRGWDTVLSRDYTDGADLSGGQWQRVGLARALYATRGGANVLVLDEPTASLDVSAEIAVFDQLLEAAEGVTSVVVSHRFSTVRRAGRIVVLEAGQVIEDGSHDELCALGGTYAQLYNLQADRFRKSDDGVEEETQ